MTVDLKTLYARAARDWHKDPQMLQAVEEMSELIKEIMKNVNRKKDNTEQLAEETADVEIILGQLKYCCGIEDKVEDYKKAKLEKISRRLDEWEKTNGK